MTRTISNGSYAHSTARIWQSLTTEISQSRSMLDVTSSDMFVTSILLQSGCVTTTFLRIVDGGHLEECFSGKECTMRLCATRIRSPNMNSYVVTPNRGLAPPVPLTSDQCSTNAQFRLATTIINSVDDKAYYFKFSVVPFFRQHLSRGLRRFCPHLYDPLGKSRSDLCKPQILTV